MKRVIVAIALIAIIVGIAFLPSVSAQDTTYLRGKLRITTTTDKSVYKVGEPVNMQLLVEQLKGRTTYTFMSSQRYDFEIYLSGKLIWRWSDGKVFLQVIGYETLKRGDARTYTESWDSTGQAVGTYELKGIWTCKYPVENPSDWTTFQLA